MTRWIPRRHARWNALASAYVDDELKDRERFEQHLVSCARCQQAVDDARAARAIVASLPPIAAPRSFQLTPAMIEAAAPDGLARKPPLILLRLAQATTAAAIIAAATIFSLDLTSSSSRAPAVDNSAGTTFSSSEVAPTSPTSSDSGIAPPVAPPALGTAEALPPTPYALPSGAVPLGPTAPVATGSGVAAGGIAPNPSPAPEECSHDSSGRCAVTGQSAQPSAAPSVHGAKPAEKSKGVLDYHSTYSGGSDARPAWYRPSEYGFVTLAALALAASVVLGIRRR